MMEVSIGYTRGTEKRPSYPQTWGGMRGKKEEKAQEWHIQKKGTNIPGHYACCPILTLQCVHFTGEETETQRG